MLRCSHVIGFVFLWGLFQAAGVVEGEAVFIRKLIDEGFPTLAEKVLFRAVKQSPEMEALASELHIRIQIAERHFDQALAQLGSCEHAESLWLFLAETARGNRQRSIAETAYRTYFKTSKNPEDGPAAFHYGQLLEERGEETAARLFYERIVKRLDSRPVKTHLAALCVEEDPVRALALCEEVQLGGMDRWFGEAVVLWSQLMIQKEEWSEAQSVLETQLEWLKQLEHDGVLSSQVSPLSGARYFLGVCYEHAGKKTAALHQLYNVFIQYGDSEWGPLAKKLTQDLIDEFEAQGKRVKVDLGENRSQMEARAFRMARHLFYDHRYAEAIPLYEDALREFSEGPDSLSALRDLLLCFIGLDDELRAKTVVAYLAERLQAGDELLVAGKTALDENQEPLAWWIYERYLTFCPEHPKVPAVLFSLAGLRESEAYLDQIIENYPESPYRVRALGRFAWNAFEAKEYKKAGAHFERYVPEESDPQKKTQAHFAWAESYRFSGQWKNALEQFRTLEKSMEEAAESFGISDESQAFNVPFHEKSLYYQAVCLIQLGTLQDAVQICERFIDQFPTSERLPQVRFTLGKTLIQTECYSGALVALESFGESPDPPFAEVIFYYRGVAQFKTGAAEQAIQTLERMVERGPASAFIFEAKLVQGQAHRILNQNEDAIRLFSDILNLASDDLMIHRASLELGRAQTDPSEKLASFQRVALLANPTDPEQAALIEIALFESLPLYLELARYEELLADCERITAEFPDGEKRYDIERLKMKGMRLKKEFTADSANDRG